MSPKAALMTIDELQPGMRIRLIRMDGEPQMTKGLEGEVMYIDIDNEFVHMKWANCITLALDMNVDEFAVISAKSCA